MYRQTIKIVRKLSLQDVLDVVHTPRLSGLVNAIWEGHPNRKIWFSQISLHAQKVASWLTAGDHEWREDPSEIEFLLDMLDEREPQPLKADEIRLQFLTILLNLILTNETPEDLVSRWYDDREDEEDDDGEDDGTAD